MAVSGSFLAGREAAVQTLVNGLVRAADLIDKDVAKAAPHVVERLGKGIVEPDLIAAALKSPAAKFVIDPRRVVEPSKAMQAYQVKLGSLKEEVRLDALFALAT